MARSVAPGIPKREGFLPCTTGARPSFDGFSRWSRCEPRNVVALRYHLVTTRPPPGGGGWLHSEGEWGRAAGLSADALTDRTCAEGTPSIPVNASAPRPAVLQRSHHPPTTPSTRNTNRRFFLASRPPPRRTAAIPCGGRSSIAFRTRPEWYRRSDHGASAPVRPQDPPTRILANSGILLFS